MVKDALVAKRFVDVAFVLVELVETMALAAMSPLTVSEPVIVEVETSRAAPVIVPPVIVESMISPLVKVESTMLLS